MRRSTSSSLLLAALLAFACRSQDGAMVSLPAEAKRTDRIPLDFTLAEALSLHTQSGSIAVRTSKEREPVLTASLSLRGPDQAEAQKALERFKVEATYRGRVLEVVVAGKPVEVEVDGATTTLRPVVSYEAWIPEGMRLLARSLAGAIEAAGPFSACSLDSDFGTVSLALCDGDAQLRTGSGDVRARSIRGPFTAVSDFGALTIVDVVGKSLLAKTKSGKVEVSRCKADSIEATSEFGDVSLADTAGTAKVETKSGALRVTGFTGSLEALNSFGAITVEGTLGGLRASTASGDVRVAVAGLLAGAPAGWELRSDFGRVELGVPHGFACELEATSGFGKITCDFDVTAHAGKHEATRLSGTIGKGGGKISLASKSGDVALRRR